MKHYIKHLLFASVLVVLLLPFVQQQFEIKEIYPLKGAYLTAEKPQWRFENYLNGSFQDSLNTYVEQHIGFRPYLVRLFNQIRLNAFGMISAQAVVLGNNGYLYELNYIKALYGLDYVGDKKIAADIEKTKFVSEWLQKQNKHLIVVLAPGKASFFPEFVPEKYKPDTVFPQNFSSYDVALTKNKVPVINGNKWFLAMKDTSRFALYPQCGIHWSYYGMGLVFDSLINTMEHLSGNRFIDFGIEKIEVSDKLKSPDRDLWEGLNILIKPNDYPMPYPEFSFKPVGEMPKPSVIIVADSYYWQWFGSGYANRAFGKNEFWYYNKQIISGDGGPTLEKINVDILQRVLSTDFIVLLQTDANMSRFSFGFIDDLYEAIQKVSALSESDLKEINAILSRIKSSESYMEMIKEKADKRKISVEEMLWLDAMWVFDNNRNQN
jgi:hypothetical protein